VDWACMKRDIFIIIQHNLIYVEYVFCVYLQGTFECMLLQWCCN
jgi:hypothetical protein